MAAKYGFGGLNDDRNDLDYAIYLTNTTCGCGGFEREKGYLRHSSCCSYGEYATQRVLQDKYVLLQAIAVVPLLYRFRQCPSLSH